VVICDVVDPEDSDSVDRIEIPISIGEGLELDTGREKKGCVRLKTKFEGSPA